MKINSVTSKNIHLNHGHMQMIAGVIVGLKLVEKQFSYSPDNEEMSSLLERNPTFGR